MPDYGDVCEEFSTRKNIRRLKTKMINSDLSTKLAEIFKILGDTTRVKILYALSKKELCVCELVELLGISQSAISHQLRLLRNAGIVKFVKKGKMVYYSLADEHVLKLIQMGEKHAKEML
jgi:DNA-binding transcriptional ArsR family regulator